MISSGNIALTYTIALTYSKNSTMTDILKLNRTKTDATLTIGVFVKTTEIMFCFRKT
jgi:hypothetical protein